MRLMMLGLALGLTVSLAAADDPFKGWTPEQLKVKVLQLQRENQALKAQLAGAPAGGAVASAPKATADMKLDDFEGATATNGQTWWAGCDAGGLGTTIKPETFAPEKGGAPASAGNSGRIHGHLGANKEPWAWAAMALNLSQKDISGYSGISFWAKGDGKVHNVRLEKAAVKDYANFSATFTAPKAWTKVTIPFSEFKQPEMWGNKVSNVMNDVEKIAFFPTTFDGDYDFQIDELYLVK